MELSVFTDGWESLLFDGRRSELDALQHGRVQDVDAGVDAVADEFDGFFNETVNSTRVVRLVHHDAILRGLFDFGHHDRSLVAVRAVEVGELLEGIFANDVRVENEKGTIVFAEDLFSQFERTRRPQGFGFNGELNLDVVFFFVLMMSIS